MHAGRQDVALLRRTWETDVANIFDTQVAAGFTGRGAQMGYEALLGDVLGVRLRKSASFTTWDQRPLTDEQVQLRARGRPAPHPARRGAAGRARPSAAAWSGRARSAGCSSRSPTTRDLDIVFGKLPRVGGLDPPIRAVARELVEWREETAREHDRPVSSVLPDAPLDRDRPPPPARTSSACSRSAASTSRPCAAAGATSSPPSSAAATASRSRATATSRSRPTRSTARRSRCARRSSARARYEAGLAYELVAARADLERIVKSVRVGAPEPDVRTLRGWRRELVGDELLELLARRPDAADRRRSPPGGRAVQVGSLGWRHGTPPTPRSTGCSPRPGACSPRRSTSTTRCAPSRASRSPSSPTGRRSTSLQPDGTLRQISSGHADPATDALLLELRERHRRRPRGRAGRRAPRGHRLRRPDDLRAAAAGAAAVRLDRRGAAVGAARARRRSSSCRCGPTAASLGALTFLSTDPDRIYKESDFPVAARAGRALRARRCATRRPTQAAESSRALLDALIDTAPVGMSFVDTDLRYVLINHHLAAINRVPVVEHLGRADGRGPRRVARRGDAARPAGARDRRRRARPRDPRRRRPRLPRLLRAGRRATAGCSASSARSSRRRSAAGRPRRSPRARRGSARSRSPASSA